MNQKKLRPPKTTDLNFIYNSWLESYKESSDNPFKTAHLSIPKKPIDKPELYFTDHPAYYSYHKMLLISILERSLITILCNPDNPDQIFGYAVYELTEDKVIIHWLHIKHIFRRLGFARFIVESIMNQAELLGIFNSIITITARGQAYKHVKDKFSHTYAPKLAFKLKEIV